MSASDIQKSRKERLPFMPKNEKTRFIELLKIQSNSDNEKRMVIYLFSKLKKMGLHPVIDKVGNILVTKGTSEMYPCICAHLDTVHSFHDSMEIKVIGKQKRELAKAFDEKNKQIGTGGDDKCGIYSVLYMLKNVENIKAVFFTNEESGMTGSSDVDFDFFEDVGYLIQLDRWGRSDFIASYSYEDTVSKDYLEKANPVLEKFGFSVQEGLITDSINLWDSDIGISCVNVSCGYYQHHTNKETVDLNELWNSILFTEELIKTLGENYYQSSPQYTPESAKGYWDDKPNTKNYWGDWGNKWDEGYKDWKTPKGVNGVERKFEDDDFVTTFEEYESLENERKIDSSLDYYYIRDIEYCLCSDLIEASDEVILEALYIMNEHYMNEGLPALTYDRFMEKLRKYYS